MENISAYHLTGIAMGLTGGLLLLQLLVADIAGMKVSRIPGAPIEPDHSNFLYRASRAMGNMNESIAIFIIFTLVGILSGANAEWLGRFAMLYVVSRVAFTLCYWMNIKMLRSVCFGISLIALLGLGVIMAGGLV